MELVELSKNAASLLDDCAAIANANHIFLQDPEWGNSQESLGKKVRRFAVIDEDKKICLFAQVIENIEFGKKYFFTPFGPVFPLDLSDESRALAFNFFSKELLKLCKDLIFLRFEPESDSVLTRSKLQIKKTIDLDPHQTLLLDLEQSPEHLLAAMKPKTRYNIRLAEKSGVEVKVLSELPIPTTGGEDPIAASAARAGISAYSREYLNSLLKFFSVDSNATQVRCYAAYHEGDLLAANIILEYAGQATYLFGGALELKRNLMPTYALHWQAIQDAKLRNCQTYDFWGVETDENHPWYGFSKFKLGFGGEIIKRPGTLDFVYSPAWYNAYVIFRKLNRLKKASFRFRH